MITREVATALRSQADHALDLYAIVERRNGTMSIFAGTQRVHTRVASGHTRSVPTNACRPANSALASTCHPLPMMPDTDSRSGRREGADARHPNPPRDDLMARSDGSPPCVAPGAHNIGTDRDARSAAMASVTKRPNGQWRARYRDSAGKEHARHFARKVD